MDIKIIIIVILLIVILLGGIYAFNKFKKNKKEESFSALLFTSGLTLVVSSSSSFFDKILVGMGVLLKYSKPIELEGDFNIYYFCLGTTLIIISIIMNIYIKKKLYVLNINGYSNKKIELFLTKIKISNYDFKEREVNFVNLYKRIFSLRLDNESFECIKVEIEDEIKTFKNETIDKKIGYTGIAPIPFIIYAGTFMDRIKIDNYYEYDKIETNTYYTLKSNKKANYPKLNIITDINEIDKNKNEIVIAISLTQPITDSAISQFVCNSNVVKMGVSKPTDNTIRYREQLNEYVNLLFEIIEQLGRVIPNLSKIHLVYSGQSCLALEIGKRCVDTTRIPQIISYQFENQSTTVKYPWGIIINGVDKGKLIKA